MENRLIAVRLSAQQLSDPRFDDPRALVRWMGAVQAQDYKAVRWAVGIRLRTPRCAPSTGRWSGARFFGRM